MWDIATSNQGGQGLATFVGTIRLLQGLQDQAFSNIQSNFKGDKIQEILEREIVSKQSVSRDPLASLYLQNRRHI